ncbi:MAG: protein kinase [Pseudomonadota bacterium]
MKTIGKYIIRGLLGRGGMSRVFLAEIPTIHRLVALKQLHPNPLLYKLMTPSQAKDMFITEATAMSLLRHRHVVDVWDYEETEDYVFYTMEYHATTLGTLIGETWRVEDPTRLIPLDTAIDFTTQVLDGLSAMHAAGIVHRDIKPFNILITADDQIKIGDFGLSRLRGELFPGPPTLKAGSPYYSAPEQAANPDCADARSDLYSTGVMLFRMLTGQLPELTTTAATTINPFLNDAWSSFFNKALQPSPQKRFASAAQMRTALTELAAEWESAKPGICRLSESATEPPARQSPTQPRCHPTKVLDIQKAQTLFSTTPLWEPRTYHKLPFRTLGDELVVDPSNHLLWQRNGSPRPISWSDAHRYVAHLNQSRLGDTTQWRLPTVNELITLLSYAPTDEHHFCAPAVFGRAQRNLWSCDRRTYTSAYVVRADIGFVTWQDLRTVADVRAVCTPTHDPAADGAS